MRKNDSPTLNKGNSAPTLQLQSRAICGREGTCCYISGVVLEVVDARAGPATPARKETQAWKAWAVNLPSQV